MAGLLHAKRSASFSDFKLVYIEKSNEWADSNIEISNAGKERRHISNLRIIILCQDCEVRGYIDLFYSVQMHRKGQKTRVCLDKNLRSFEWFRYNLVQTV